MVETRKVMEKSSFFFRNKMKENHDRTSEKLKENHVLLEETHKNKSSEKRGLERLFCMKAVTGLRYCCEIWLWGGKPKNLQRVGSESGRVVNRSVQLIFVCNYYVYPAGL